MQSRVANIGRGFSWLTEAVSYFTASPLAWIAAIVVLFIISIVVNIIPFGSLLMNVFYPVIVGGYMIGCAAHKNGYKFEFQHIFTGFSEPYFKRLVLVGVINLCATIVIVVLLIILIFTALGGMEFLHQLDLEQYDQIPGHLTEMLMLLLIAAALFLPLVMAMWFAPVIIISSEEDTLSALKLSLNACIKNILPFTVYGLFLFVLSIIAAIPFMLGYLILLPILTASVYVSFLDCFEQESETNQGF